MSWKWRFQQSTLHSGQYKRIEPSYTRPTFKFSSRILWISPKEYARLEILRISSYGGIRSLRWDVEEKCVPVECTDRLTDWLDKNRARMMYDVVSVRGWNNGEGMEWKLYSYLSKKRNKEFWSGKQTSFISTQSIIWPSQLFSLAPYFICSFSCSFHSCCCSQCCGVFCYQLLLHHI